jgi:uncharacterized SAM-binding protein YcdF (DUF218 family)
VELPGNRTLYLGIPQVSFASMCRRLLIALLALVLGAAVLLAVPVSRHELLRSAGTMLVAQDPLAKADIIIVSTDSLSEGVFEASELVHAGIAARVGLFEQARTPMQSELERRGLPRFDIQAYSIELLHALGITQIELIPPVVGTNDEGAVLRRWCAAKNIRSVVFVSVADHSRRSRRVLGRALARNGVSVTVRWARYSQFDPDTWWQSRNGQRTEIAESQKLLADILQHPW